MGVAEALTGGSVVKSGGMEPGVNTEREGTSCSRITWVTSPNSQLKDEVRHMPTVRQVLCSPIIRAIKQSLFDLRLEGIGDALGMNGREKGS